MTDWLTYTNQGAIRNQPLSPELLAALGYLGDMGLSANVYSGGQAAIGTSDRRTGSTRHDLGNAADLYLTHPELGMLTYENPQHIPILQEVVRQGRATGLTGIGMGPGYMGPNGIHLGFGAEAVWGANGSSENAPDWLREAFYGATPGQAPAPSAYAGLAFDPSGWDQSVHDAISGAASRHGVPAEHLYALAQIESSGNPNAQNPNSSASGLFQFINSTASQYGLNNPLDAAANADAAARLYLDNQGPLREILGRDPTVGEMYLAHQQGLGGATNLLRDPNALAVDIVGSQAVTLNGGTPDMTAQEFANIWTSRADGLLGGNHSMPVGQPNGSTFDPTRPTSVFNMPPGAAPPPTLNGAPTEASIWDQLAGMAATSSIFSGPAVAPPQLQQAPRAQSLQITPRDTISPYMQLFQGLRG